MATVKMLGTKIQTIEPVSEDYVPMGETERKYIEHLFKQDRGI